LKRKDEEEFENEEEGEKRLVLLSDMKEMLWAFDGPY